MSLKLDLLHSHCVQCFPGSEYVLKIALGVRLLFQSRYGAADRGVRLYSSLPMRPNPDGKRLPSTGVRLISLILLSPCSPLLPHPSLTPTLIPSLIPVHTVRTTVRLSSAQQDEWQSRSSADSFVPSIFFSF